MMSVMSLWRGFNVPCAMCRVQCARVRALKLNTVQYTRRPRTHLEAKKFIDDLKDSQAVGEFIDGNWCTLVTIIQARQTHHVLHRKIRIINHFFELTMYFSILQSLHSNLL